jgi:hypothetical protein
MRGRVTAALFLAACALPLAGAAQSPSSDSGSDSSLAEGGFVRDANRHATLRAIHLAQPLRLDGRLDEDVYRTTPPIVDFIQTLPRENAAPTERTDAWVMFDETHIYVAARLWDSAPPDEWTANEMRRDTQQLRQNDHFGVSFDTFHDRRNGYFFYANPLGARADAYMTDETNNNADWNPVWEARTGRFEGGWTVEMAIPFKSMRYLSGASQMWGINMRRAIRRKNEWNHLSPLPLSIGGSIGMMRVSAGADLIGLDLPAASRNLEIKPYAIARATTDRLAAPPVSNKLDRQIGFDAKYGITANLTADLTVNTDFAQVEVDEQQVNLTRFNLVYPEKREFFLEGRGIFDFGRGGSGDTPSLFYSRRIGIDRNRVVPIDAGGRLTGKAGGFSVGAINIQTGDAPAAAAPSTNFTVLRVKRDILRRSTVGAMFTNRSHSTVVEGSNQAYGVDAAFSFFQNLSMGGYLARSITPGRTADDLSYSGRFDYNGDRYGARAEYLTVGDNFNPEVGFVRRDDFTRSFSSLRFSPRPRSMNGVRQFTFEGSLEYIEDGAGRLESRQQSGGFNIEFESSDQASIEGARYYDRLVEPFEVSRGVLVPEGGYTFSNFTARYVLGQQRRASGTLAFQAGHYYDGDIRAVTVSGARVSITPQLSVEPGISVNHIDVPGGAFTTQVLRARTDFAFTPRMFASGLFQYGSSDRTFTSNVRFRWEYRPGSELFVVYTDERDTAALGGGALRNRAFVVKINRLWQF